MAPRLASRILLPLCALLFVFYLFPFPSIRHKAEDRPVATPSAPQIPLKQEQAPLPDAKTEVQGPSKLKPPPPPLAKHTYRADGLLEVDPNGPHPIYELIEKAEKRWKDKLGRASTTLGGAVKEYRRRYKREPPKGFDLWWKYVVENKVQLPDEYDQIFHDIEPFWGVDPADLRKTQEDLEKKKDSFTLGKNEQGIIEVLAWAFQDGMYERYIRSSVPLIEMLRMVENDLPDFRATFSPHDGPNRLSDYNIKSAVLAAAASKTVLGRAAMPSVTARGWRFACPPDSPARQNPVNIKEDPVLSTTKTFIYDHVRSMDPCLHTNHLAIHGQFLGQADGPPASPSMVPEFGHCSTTMHHNIRMPSPYAWIADVNRADDPPFFEKVDDRLLWRGRNTGISHNPKSLWRNSHRDYFVRRANEIAGTLDVLHANVSREAPVGTPRTLRKSRVNPAMLDIAFADYPVMCSPDTCKLLEDIYPFRAFQSTKEAGRYKYVFDIDGNGWSGRFKRLITTNALVFKATIYPEWFHDRVEPWVHYVPVQLDLTDLYDALIFFRGDGNGEGAHEDLGQKIAVQGRAWSLQFWRKEDLVAYFFRLILEYARVQSLDRDSMSFVLPEDER